MKRTVPVIIGVFILLLCLSFEDHRIVSTISKTDLIFERPTIVIDAGHGGVDGGAVSCTGVHESHINLEISLRLRDLFALLGFSVKMIRTDDRSVYTSGETIAAKKMSDLRHRVKMINETENPLLISIHQNIYQESKYAGAQIFYADTEHSKELAEYVQRHIKSTINPSSNRKVKKSSGVYLMEHIECTGILVECGFLSNPEEEALLRTPGFQKKICSVIAMSVASFIANT